MQDLLRDGVWQFVGVLVGVIGILVAIIIYYFQRQQKELAFGTMLDRNLLNVSDQLAQKVIVTFDGDPVKNIRMVLLGFKNSGTSPILETDFQQPVRITFGNEAKLLSVEVTSQVPSNLKIVASHIPESDCVELAPLLLNSGDYFVLQALVSVQQLSVAVDARIVGVASLAEITSGYRVTFARSIRTIGLFIAVSFTLYGASYVSRKNDGLTPGTILFAIGLVTLTALGQWLYGNIGKRARRYINGALR